MSRIRALFMGTPEIARFCLEAMIKDPHFEVVGVVTQPDRPAGRKLQLQPSPVKVLVKPLPIPILTPENVNAPEVLEQIAAFKAEVAVVVAFGQILKKPLLQMFPAKVVNVHASVLPRWRGAAPIQRALMAGDTEGGVSLQVMVRKLDAGPLLGVRRFALPAEMTASDLYQKCSEKGAQLLSIDLMDYLRGNLGPTPQDEALVTHAAKIDKQEAAIDWQRPASDLHNLVRGLALGPQAHTALNGKRLVIHRTRVGVAAPDAALQPGQVQAVTENSLLVRCGTGTLELLEVQPESRAKMSTSDFLRGHALKVGDSFSVQNFASGRRPN